jgi:hypothetical protein
MVRGGNLHRCLGYLTETAQRCMQGVGVEVRLREPEVVEELCYVPSV